MNTTDPSDPTDPAAPPPPRPDPPRPRRRLGPTGRRTVLVALVVLGLAVGATIGGSLGERAGRDVSATALVQVVAGQDPMLGATSPLRALPGDTQTFVANELAYLGSAAFTDAVVAADPTSSTDAGSPRLTVQRQGQSEVLAFTAAAPTLDAATGRVDTAVQVYTAARVERLRTEVDRAYDDVQSALDVVANSPVAVSEAEQQARVALLREQQSQLLRMRAESADPVQRLGPTTADPAPVASPTLVGALLGAVLGGLLVVGLGRLRPHRRESPRRDPDRASP